MEGEASCRCNGELGSEAESPFAYLTSEEGWNSSQLAGDYYRPLDDSIGLTPHMLDTDSSFEYPTSTEEWPSSQLCGEYYGDYYRGRDDFMGCTHVFGASSPECLTSEEAWNSSPIHGDYYRHLDDQTRDAEMGGTLQFALWENYRNSRVSLECLDVEVSFLGQELLLGMDASAPKLLPEAYDSHGHFQDNRSVAAQPPLIPSNPCFRLEPTTLHVQGAAACNLWNCLQRFFEGQVVASVTKSNEEKHSIKANLLYNDLATYTVKVRTYTGHKGLVVEMQRRIGDSVGFNDIFACLSRHVAEQLPSAMVDPIVSIAEEVLSLAPCVAWGAAAAEGL